MAFLIPLQSFESIEVLSIMEIVILGAGYAGLRTVIELDKLRCERTNPVRVTLVDRNPYHQIVQELHLTATNATEPAETAIPLAEILRKRRADTLQGCVTRIEPLQRQVRLADGQTLPYDRLVIALGAETNYWNIPGAREHTLPLRTYDQALRLRDHIAAQFRAAAQTTDPALRRVLLAFALVGGGYTGCQLAGELAVWARALADEHGVPRSAVRIALIEQSSLLLKQFGRWATRYAERVLTGRGVDVHLNTNVERVEQNALFVSGNRVLRAGTIIWVAGIRAPALLAESGLPTDELGRVLVDRYLRVQDQALIFAAGDCAHIPDRSDGVVPATASYAMRQGEHLARTLLAEVEGRAPRPYTPLRLGELVSLGPGEAIGEPLGVPLVGPPAALLKKAVEAWYRSTLW